MLKKSYILIFVLLLIVVIGTGSAQQVATHFNNALNYLHYYSQGLDRLIPGLKPLDNAAASFRSSIKAGQATDESLLFLALISEQQGDLASAKSSYYEYLNRNESELWVYALIGDLDYQLGDLEAAVENYNKAITSDEYTNAYYGLGRIYSEQGDSAAAITALAKSVELSPGYTDARISLAKEYYYAQQYDEALEEFEMAYKYNPRNAQVHYYLWLLYNEQGDQEKANHSKILAIKYDPSYESLMEN